MLVFKSALLVNRLKESFSFNVCVELNCKYAVVIRTKTERDCAQRAQVVAVVVEKGEEDDGCGSNRSAPSSAPRLCLPIYFPGNRSSDSMVHYQDVILVHRTEIGAAAPIEINSSLSLSSNKQHLFSHTHNYTPKTIFNVLICTNN